MKPQEQSIRQFGTVAEIARAIVEYTTRKWLHCERHAFVVASWACDSYLSSQSAFGDWAHISGTPLRREIESAVEARIVAARLDKGRARRAWARDVAVAYGTDEQAERAHREAPPRAEVEELVFGFLGVGHLPVASVHCKHCGKILERAVEILLDSRFAATADKVVETIERHAVGFRVSSEQLMATYRCKDHGVLSKYELQVHMEHIETGWIGKRRFDLAGCHCELADFDAEDVE